MSVLVNTLDDDKTEGFNFEEHLKAVTSQCLSHSQMADRLISKIFIKMPVKGMSTSASGQLNLVNESSVIGDFTRIVISPPGVNQLNEMVAAERIVYAHIKYLYLSGVQMQIPVYGEDEELGPIPIGSEVYLIDTDRRQLPIASYDESNHIFILDFTGGER